MLDSHLLGLRLQGAQIPDNVDVEGYDEQYLPKWEKVKQTLLKTYEEVSPESTGEFAASTGLPMMFTPGQSRSQAKHKGGNGVATANTRCFGCGEYGHKKGDPQCKASPGQLHDCAPNSWKGKGGSGNVPGSKPRNAAGVEICRMYTRTGNCRFGQNCKFAHE